MNPSIQKALESFEEKFLTSGEKDFLLCDHFDDVSANEAKSFLTQSLQEISEASHKEGYDLGYKAGHHEGYKKGMGDAKEKIIEADKQIGNCYPFLTTENDADKEQMDKYNKLVYFFFHKVMENSIAALNELTDKS